MATLPRPGEDLQYWGDVLIDELENEINASIKQQTLVMQMLASQ